LSPQNGFVRSKESRDSFNINSGVDDGICNLHYEEEQVQAGNDCISSSIGYDIRAVEDVHEETCEDYVGHKCGVVHAEYRRDRLLLYELPSVHLFYTLMIGNLDTILFDENEEILVS